MIDPRLAVPPALLQQLHTMKERHSSLDEMISFLQQNGLEAPRAKIALVTSGVAAPGEAKRAIHASPAYADRHEADEVFEASVVASLESMEDEDRIASAACSHFHVTNR